MRKIIVLFIGLGFMALSTPAEAKMCAWFAACEGGRCGAPSGSIWTSGATCGLPLNQSGAGQTVSNLLRKGFKAGWCECSGTSCNKQHNWVRQQWKRTKKVPANNSCPR